MDNKRQIDHKGRGITTMQKPTWLRKSIWKFVCWQRNTIILSQKQTFTQTHLFVTKLFHWSVQCCTWYRLSGVPVLKNLFCLWNEFFGPGMYKWVRTRPKSCQTCRRNEQIRKDQNIAPNQQWGKEVPYPHTTLYTMTIKDLSTSWVVANTIAWL